MINFRVEMPDMSENEHLSKIISNLYKMNKITPNIGEKIQLYETCYVITDKKYSDISMGNTTIIYTISKVE